MIHRNLHSSFCTEVSRSSVSISSTLADTAWNKQLCNTGCSTSNWPVPAANLAIRRCHVSKLLQHSPASILRHKTAYTTLLKSSTDGKARLICPAVTDQSSLYIQCLRQITQNGGTFPQTVFTPFLNNQCFVHSLHSSPISISTVHQFTSLECADLQLLWI